MSCAADFNEENLFSTTELKVSFFIMSILVGEKMRQQARWAPDMYGSFGAPVRKSCERYVDGSSSSAGSCVLTSGLTQKRKVVSSCNRVVGPLSEPCGVVPKTPKSPFGRSETMPVSEIVTRGSAA